MGLLTNIRYYQQRLDLYFMCCICGSLKHTLNEAINVYVSEGGILQMLLRRKI